VAQAFLSNGDRKLRYPALPATITIDIDPVILRLGDLAISWYGLAVLSAIGADSVIFVEGSPGAGTRPSV